MLKITSRHNPKLKYLKTFHHRKHRDREGMYLIEGVRVVEAALRAGVRMEALVVTPAAAADPEIAGLVARALARGGAVWEVDPAALRELALTETPQGVLALVRKQAPAPDKLLGAPGLRRIVVVDGIQDPGNLGTIVRTADACAMHGVVLLRGTVDLYHPKVVRAAAGSLFHLAVADQMEPAGLVAGLKAHGFRLFAGDSRGNRSLFDCDFGPRTALAVGHETRGTCHAIRQAADGMVFIPMPGRAESLNVGVAAALLMYEAVRRQAPKDSCVTEGPMI